MVAVGWERSALQPCRCSASGLAGSATPIAPVRRNWQTNLVALQLQDLKTSTGILMDGVFVCVPPSYRGPVELQCLANSIPLFVEKPIGLSVKHIVPLLEQAKRVGVVNAVGYMNRYRNSIRLAKKVLSSRKVLGISCVWVGKRYRVPWWIEPNLSGGPFNEQATHVLDLCRFLLGEIESVTALAAPVATAGDPEFGVAVAMRFIDGPVGTYFIAVKREKRTSISMSSAKRALFI